MPINSRLITAVLFTLPFVLPVALGSDLYLPSIPRMPQELSTKPEHIQLTLTIYMYFFGLGQLIIGPLADKYGRKKILLASLILFVIGSFICAHTHHLSHLMAGRALQAFGACGSQVAALAMLRDKFQGKDLIFIFSFLRAAGAISPIISPFIGAFLYATFGWQAIFLVLTAYGSLIFFFAFYNLEETAPTPKQSPSLLQSFTTYKEVAKNANFIYFASCAIIAQTAIFSHFSFSSLFYMNQHHLPASHFALLFSINACFFMLTGILGGKLIPRWGLRKSTFVGAILFMLSGICMYFANVFYDHFLVLFLPFLIANASGAIMLAASSAGTLMPFKHTAGAAAALAGCLEAMGGGLLGTTAIKGATSVLPLAMCLLFLGTLLLLLNLTFSKYLQPTNKMA